MLVVSAFTASTLQAQQQTSTTVVRTDSKTGRLIRTVVVPRPRVVASHDSASAPATDASLNALIERIAGEQGVESQLVHSVIQAESNYNAAAVSPKGASGLMQLIPATARRFGVADTFDPEENIEGGVRYLRFLLDYYQGDYPKAIAAYNAGEGAVDRYHGIPPYAETRNYVYRVARNLEAERQSARQRPIVTQAPASAANTETPSPIIASTGSDGRIYYRTP